MKSERIIHAFIFGNNLTTEQGFMVCRRLRNWQGDLTLTDTKIKKLPDNLVVEGNLVLLGTIVTELPKQLHVKKDLYMSYMCPILDISPLDLSGVQGKVFLSAKQYKRIKTNYNVRDIEHKLVNDKWRGGE